MQSNEDLNTALGFRCLHNVLRLVYSPRLFTFVTDVQSMFNVSVRKEDYY